MNKKSILDKTERESKALYLYRWMMENEIKLPPEIWIRICVVISKWNERTMIKTINMVKYYEVKGFKMTYENLLMYHKREREYKDK
jgi:hypothetical protein